jgi:hypothetical protein
MFKVGDLVQLDTYFNPERHPPLGTMGVVIDVESFGDVLDDFEPPPKKKCEPHITESLEPGYQLIRVQWAHSKNFDEQCYVSSSLKMVVACV